MMSDCAHECLDRASIHHNDCTQQCPYLATPALDKTVSVTRWTQALCEHRQHSDIVFICVAMLRRALIAGVLLRQRPHSCTSLVRRSQRAESRQQTVRGAANDSLWLNGHNKMSPSTTSTRRQNHKINTTSPCRIPFFCASWCVT